MASSRKKVVVRTLAGEVAAGYLPAAGFVDYGAVELLDLEGKVKSLRMSSLQWIAYVRDFNSGEAEPERLGRRSFRTRPKGEGVWLRVRLVGELEIEGLSAFDLALIDGFVADGGLFLTPADPRSNTMRLFVPRTAMVGVEALGLLGVAAKARRSEKDRSGEGQERLFPS